MSFRLIRPQQRRSILEPLLIAVLCGTETEVGVCKTQWGDSGTGAMSYTAKTIASVKKSIVSAKSMPGHFLIFTWIELRVFTQESLGTKLSWIGINAWVLRNSPIQAVVSTFQSYF